MFIINTKIFSLELSFFQSLVCELISKLLLIFPSLLTCVRATYTEVISDYFIISILVCDNFGFGMDSTKIQPIIDEGYFKSLIPSSELTLKFQKLLHKKLCHLAFPFHFVGNMNTQFFVLCLYIKIVASMETS